MAKLSNIAKSTHAHILLYGPPKTGKTKSAGTLSKKYNLLWFDLENGVSTLKQLPIEQQERIEVISIPDTRTWPIAIETCLKFIKGIKGDICEEHGKYGCASCKVKGKAFTTVDPTNIPEDTIVVFDSLTQLTNSAIANITKDKDDDYKLTYEDWGNLGKLMDVFLSHIQQAKFKAVCISHETEVIMEDDSIKIVPTAGTRNFSRNVAKYFDTVAYVFIHNKTHKMNSSTIANNKIVSGSRQGVKLEDFGADDVDKMLYLFEEAPAKKEEEVNKSNAAASKILAGIKKS